MFPVADATQFQFVLVVVVLFSALAFRFGLVWRLAFLLLAVLILVGWLRLYPISGEYAGLGYLFTIVPWIFALCLGAAFGAGMRYGELSPRKSVLILLFGASAASSLALWAQYVPAACLEVPLQVRIGDRTLNLPAELRPRLENKNGIFFFGRDSRKSSSARLCRMSSNGTREITMSTVWITPSSNHETMSAVCKGQHPPTWCRSYSSEPYRHLGKVLIAPDTIHAFPMPYWREGGSLKKDRQGDLIRGSVCLLPEPGRVTTCYAWEPFGDGYRLLFVTENSFDPVFKDMAVSEARQLIHHARGMLLDIISSN